MNEYSDRFFSTMIEIHPNSIILYYAALMPNIEVKFRNLSNIPKIDFSSNLCQFSFRKILYFCNIHLKFQQ